ncbi:DUF551 domain-containing protein [Massilia sp. GCM10020059]|uniref:DUF551 domain-containing protein n=1 Tax=Massilia agrisoli TaxID=2892444 RepID=A0ABS8IS13_9BURK|nr:DUF551 domain-containing protein [Massilia agrisoli]MCC6071432.1 DUF551 domain-containing protein [Massilia agrisoli]
MNTWTNVNEALPDADLAVLIAMSDGDVWLGYLDGEIWRDVGADVIAWDRVTHWMHLPPAPGSIEEV